MLLTRRTHRLTTWLAMLAMLWGALVPTLAQAAVASSGSQGWVEVCSASGVAWVRLDGSTQSPDSEQVPMSGALSSCAWCLTQGATHLPPAPTTTVAPDLTPAAVPGVAFESILPWAVWSTAQSRAPPLV
jgi:hypothetical protein